MSEQKSRLVEAADKTAWEILSSNDNVGKKWTDINTHVAYKTGEVLGPKIRGKSESISWGMRILGDIKYIPSGIIEAMNGGALAIARSGAGISGTIGAVFASAHSGNVKVDEEELARLVKFRQEHNLQYAFGQLAKICNPVKNPQQFIGLTTFVAGAGFFTAGSGTFMKTGNPSEMVVGAAIMNAGTIFMFEPDIHKARKSLAASFTAAGVAGAADLNLRYYTEGVADFYRIGAGLLFSGANITQHSSSTFEMVERERRAAAQEIFDGVGIS